MTSRLLAAACCLFATGCAMSLGVTVPGAPQWELRSPAGPTAPAAPREETRLALGLAREAASLTLVAELATHRTLTGEFRRTRQPLTYAVAWSLFAEESERIVAIALLPVVVPVLVWQLMWWVYGRGLSAEERALRPAPWGTGIRNLWWEAFWPGINAEDLWRWRADLLALDDPVLGPWRFRSVTQTAPVADRPVGLAVDGEVQPMGATDPHGRAYLALTPPSDATKPWEVGRRRVEVAEPLELTATVDVERGRTLTARASIDATYLATALRVRALREQQRRTGRSAKLHAELAACYTQVGGHVQARAEWRWVGRLGDDADRARATQAIAAAWQAERDAARRHGDVRHALFCDAAARLEAQWRAGSVDATRLEGAPETVAARLRGSAADVRAATALAVAGQHRDPDPAVRRALLEAAADYTHPVASWAALQALIRHPDRDAPGVLHTLLVPDVPAALQQAAAAAMLAADPEYGLRLCVSAADLPAVQWVLADATAAALDPAVSVWEAWRLEALPAHRWDAAAAMFLEIPGAR